MSKMKESTRQKGNQYNGRPKTRPCRPSNPAKLCSIGMLLKMSPICVKEICVIRGLRRTCFLVPDDEPDVFLRVVPSHLFQRKLLRGHGTGAVSARVVERRREALGK